MQFKTKVVSGVAGVMLVPMIHEPAPRLIEPDDCAITVGMNICSAAEDPLVEPRNVHTPHHEFDPQVPGGYAWIASGQVNSTSTGPLHSGWIGAGETLFRR